SLSSLPVSLCNLPFSPFKMVAASPSLAAAKYQIYDAPFAHQLLNNLVENYCSFCLRTPNEGRLLKCGGCQFSKYCDAACQRKAWSTHKHECARLKKVFPNLPMTEVMFLSKVLDRVIFLSKNGDEPGWERERTFLSLVDHREDIEKDTNKMEHFEKIIKKMTVFRGDEMVDREFFFNIFCKVSINSHSIHSNAGIEIGMALDLGISKYNHCCRPTVAMVFDGIRVFLRPLVPSVSLDDLDNAFISYIDVGRSRYRRRIDLKTKWFFHCECSRCMDPDDNRLTALKCMKEGCDGLIMTAEDEEAMDIACPECGVICDESRVKEGQDLMKRLPPSFDPNCPVETVQAYLDEGISILHPSNVYITRLQTALLHLKGELDNSLHHASLHKSIYDNYKLCFPKADRHLAFSLLKVVTSLIRDGKRKEAVLYAYEAMTILEVCMGLEHPYYLKTLALWTFLQNDAPKTDDELISLTIYGDNKPVNISKLLEFTQPKLQSLTM
ncbi:hypothetical protein PENTCL1PPCAC_1495, partial [Pristionchus entomophagus]